MIPDAYWLEEYEEADNQYLIDGLLSPFLTVLSGQPKVGKSTFATQLSKSVINKTTLLNKAVRTEKSRVCWMGYDAGFVSELKGRVSEREYKSILIQNPIMSMNLDVWNALGERLVSQDIAFIVVDQLYGFAGHLKLNENQEARKVTQCFDVLTLTHKIPVMLIAQAPKNFQSGGGAAHSNLLKSSARLLLEMSGAGERKTLKTIGNEIALETLRFNQNPTEINTIEKVEKASKVNRDYQKNLKRAKKLMENAQPQELKNPNTAAHVLLRLGESTSISGAVKMAYRLVEAGLIEQSPAGLSKGKNCFD